jgi:hypothetical protein
MREVLRKRLTQRAPQKRTCWVGEKELRTCQFQNQNPHPLIFWVPFVYKSDALLDFLLGPQSWYESPIGAAGVARASWTLLWGLGKSTALPSDLQTLREG